MTAAILTRLPLEAGGAVLATTGRAVHSLVAWGFAHYMRAPLASTGVAAMLTLGFVASSNALYFQHARHPSPLFTTDSRPVGAIDPRVEPVTPAPRPVKKLTQTSPAPKLVVPKVETASAQKPAEKPIGNADVFAIQRKLESMKLFSGTVDGYYGPQTAGAIRAFEKAQGLKQTGELTPAIIEAILAAKLASPEPKVIEAPQPVPSADPLPKVVTQTVEPTPAVAKEPVAEALPLPMPEPQPQVTAVIQPVQQKPVSRELPKTPQEAMNIAADTAGDAIETIINGVQSLAMTTPPERKPKAEILTPAPLQFETRVASTPAAAKVQTPPATDPQVTASVTPVAAPAATATAAVAVKPQEVPVLDTEAKVEELRPASQVNDPVFVARVQRGLASLGFLYGPIDGKPSEATARAIRTFETFYNYERTGRITPELPDLLVKAGATL